MKIEDNYLFASGGPLFIKSGAKIFYMRSGDGAVLFLVVPIVTNLLLYIFKWNYELQTPQDKSFWKSRNLFTKRFLAAGGIGVIL